MLSQKYYPEYAKHKLSINYKRPRKVVNNVLFAMVAAGMLLCHGDIDLSVAFQPCAYDGSVQSISQGYPESEDLAEQIACMRKKAWLPMLAGKLGRTNAGAAQNISIDIQSYTGSYSIIDDGGGDSRVKFLTSGTLILNKTVTVDVFLVGGGGSGGYGGSGNYGSAGGGGYTTTSSGIVLEAGVSYDLIIGAGGVTPYSGNDGNDGGQTAIALLGSNIAYANGGYGGIKNGTPSYPRSAGASGGASINTTAVGGYVGGSDGSTPVNGGTGQGTTTREFGESTGDLYAAGGGGCEYNTAQQFGGLGGGGNGAVTASSIPSTAGIENTGSGGGGAGAGNLFGGSTAGGSGILIIRNHRAA